MRILEVEALFQSEGTLDQALELCKEDFEKVDYWAEALRSGVVDNTVEANKALGELTGTFSNLRTALAIAETEKKNREVRKYNEIRMQVDGAGKKFVSATADKQASDFVSKYRRVRNIVAGYKEACEKDISSLQSILKDLDKDRRSPGE